MSTDYHVHRDTKTKSLTSAWVTMDDDDYVLIQSSAPVRVTWGSNDVVYFTYEAVEPILLPAGFRIRAETTATLTYVGVSSS